MGTSERERTDPPFGALLVLLLVVAGVAVQNVPLNSGRPKARDAGNTGETVAHRVDARLWQDPFGAIPAPQTGKGLELTGGTLQTLIAHGVTGCRLDVLGVMLLGGPYEELAEQRRRARFAVVAGLNSLNRYPDDPEKLNYLTRSQIRSSVSGSAKPTKSSVSAEAAELPKLLPFELFVSDSKKESPGLKNDSPVLVLWIDEGWLSREPLARLTTLRRHVDAQLAPLFRECRLTTAQAVTWRFLGPISSSTLRAIRKVPPPSRTPTPPSSAAPAPLFFSAQATWHERSSNLCIDDSLEEGKPCRKTPPSAVVVRTIADDLRVSGALARELQLRDIFAKRATVALISEWDTPYGRELPRYFRQAVSEACLNNCVEPQYIETGYMRAMDGALAAGQRNDSEDRKSRDSESETDKLRLSGNATPEHAEGNPQLDYLRRLAVDLHSRHRALIGAGEPGIRAIGVLGSDVYDKLMLLRALRPLLPEALYFTIDLDARLHDAEHAKWSRNLIVASSMGLQLHPSLQHNVPPFRDSYQTATYLATIAALNRQSHEVIEKRLTTWLDKPRVYEIGTTAFPLVRDRVGASSGEGSECSPFQLTACDTLHPTQAGSRLSARGALPLAAGFAVAAGLGLLLSARFRSFALNNRPMIGRVTIGAILVTAVILYWFDSKILADPDQEPFTLLGGISIWPSTLIRLLALLLALGFMISGWYTTKRRLEEIEEKFFPGIKLETKLAQKQTGSSFQRDRHDGTSPVDTRQLWEEYRHHREPARATLCIGTFVLLVFGLAWCLILLDHRPITPCRGALSCETSQWVLKVAVFAFVALLGLVVRETYLCQRFIRVLYAGPSNWPPETGRESDTSTKYARDWLCIRLVARLTSGIGKLIYGPFLVILLLIVARSSIFDQWHLPLGLLSIFVMSLVFAATAAFQMRSAAEHARGQALESMADERRRLLGERPTTSLAARSKGSLWNGAGSSKRAEIAQIDSYIDETRGLSTGAFRPFFQQPIVRAALLPLGGYGGVAVLEYLALFSQ
jgi:hypothetical protein